MDRIKIFIVDDHQIFIDGLQALLSSEENMLVVGTALNGAKAVSAISTLQVDIVLMDVIMPDMDGIATVETLRMHFPHLKILLVSMYAEPAYIKQGIKAGANGYILKNTQHQELLSAIRHVVSGQMHFCADTTALLVDEWHTLQMPEPPRLTSREMDILRLIAQDIGTHHIAQRLSLSARTVEDHKRNIMHKLNISNPAGLLHYAVDKGLI